MSIKVQCGQCRTKFGVPEKFAGKRIKCPKCKQGTIEIPARDEPAAEAAASQPATREPPASQAARPKKAPAKPAPTVQPPGEQSYVKTEEAEEAVLGEGPTPGATPRVVGCAACGGKVSVNAKCCPHCGQPMPQEAPSAQTRWGSAVRKTGERSATDATRVCEWCSKSIPQSALKCPHCTRFRRDIDKARTNAWVGLIGSVFMLCGVVFIFVTIYQGRSTLGGRERPWHEKEYYEFGPPRNFLEAAVHDAMKAQHSNYHWRFSLRKFVQSGWGWLVIASAAAGAFSAGVAMYNRAYLRRQTGHWELF